MRHLEIEVTNAAELLATEAYGAGALLRWESSAAEAGTYVEGGTEALVSGTTLYDVWDAAGIETTWYRTRISDAAGTTFSAYSDPRSPVTSLVSIAEVRALINSRLGDVDLQAVIDREEAWLAGRVGPLAGQRTDTFRPGLGDTTLYLRRRAESVVVTDDGVTLVADTDYLFTPVDRRAPARSGRLAWSGVVHGDLDAQRRGRRQAGRHRARPRHGRRDGPRLRDDRRLLLHPRRERRARRACRARPEHPPAPAGLLDADPLRMGAGMSFDALLLHTLAVERRDVGRPGVVRPAVPAPSPPSRRSAGGSSPSPPARWRRSMGRASSSPITPSAPGRATCGRATGSASSPTTGVASRSPASATLRAAATT